jgi:amidase
VGLKPSRGRVPLGPAVGEAVGGFAHEFALTRTVRDAAALLDAVCGPAPGDRYYVSRPQDSYAQGLAQPLSRLRIALQASSPFGLPATAEAAALAQSAASALEALGHRVQEARAPLNEEALRSCMETIWSVDLASLAAVFGRLGRREPGPEQVEAASWACIRRGREIGALELESAAGLVNSLSRRWGAFLEEFDLYLCPTVPDAAPPSGVPDQDGEGYATAGAWLDELFGRTPSTPLANITGQPAISLPLGESAEGMPLGVMLTAQTLREDLLLRVGAALEEALPWRARRPPVDAGAG